MNGLRSVAVGSIASVLSRAGILSLALGLSCSEPRVERQVGADDWREALGEPEVVRAGEPSRKGNAEPQATPQGALPPASTGAASDGSATGDVPVDRAAAAPPEVKETLVLLAAGELPHEALRLTPAVGLVETITAKSVPKVKLTMDGKTAPPQTQPGTEMTMRFSVSDVGADGAIRYDYGMLSSKAIGAGVNPQLLAAANKSFALLEGIEGWAKISPLGAHLDGAVKLPPDTPEQVRAGLQLIEESSRPMVPRLPEQAVGIGARWEHQQWVEQGGLRIKQVSTYELESRLADALRLKVLVVQSASAQTIPGPNGAKIEMGAMKGKGQGVVEMKLSGIVPTSAELELVTDVQMTSQGQTLQIHSQLSTKLTRATARPAVAVRTGVGATPVAPVKAVTPPSAEP